MRSQTRWVSLLAFVIACAACSGKKDEPQEATDSASGGVIAADMRSTDEVRQEIGVLVDRLVAEAAKLPRADFDPAALAAALGRNPQAHFEWVRDNTSWAPYRGLLRGSQGVLLDRVGSSLDRAVLLGDLLRRSGHSIRIAHATLPEQRARELLEKVRPMPARNAMEPGASSAPDRSGSDKDERVAASIRAAAMAEELIASQSDALLAALKQAGVPRQADEVSALAAMRDYWWIEYEAGGEWTALDVLLPDSAAGAALASSSSRSAWGAANAFPSIPDSEWHVVDMRVVVERYDAGETSEAAVFEASLRPAESLGRPLRLSHMPMPWPEEIPDPDVDPQPFRDAALATTMWVPVLQIGDERFAQSGFTDKGELKSELEDTLSEISRVGGGEVVSGMDMALGGFGTDEATPAASAEWIDYEIRIPGSTPQRLRRPVFDLLGPARRASKAADFDGTPDLRRLERFEALWAPIDILLQPSDFTGSFVAHLNTSGLIANQDALRKLAREEDPARAQAMAREILGRIEIWDALPDYALWKRDFHVQTAGSFIDRPNVIHLRGGRRLVNPAEGTFHELIDVASNPAGVRTGTARDPFEIRVRQGVTDTVAEMLALGRDLDMAENTASVFGRLARQNSRGMVLAAGDEAAARALPWPEDEIERVVDNVRAGYVVIVPRQAVMIGDQQRVGWWRVHPASGETIGVMDNGFHAMTLERAKLLFAAVGAFLARPGELDRIDRTQRVIRQGGERLLSNSQRVNYQIYQAYRELAHHLDRLDNLP